MSLPASRCQACRRVDVPPADRCPACAGPTTELTVAPQGTVLARTRRPGGPWILLVELEEGARALATSDDRAAHVGRSVELTLSEGGSSFRVPREP